jgi:hypothetical protein
MNDNIIREVNIFYNKLMLKESESAKMRWNAICEDLTSIYLYEFKNDERKFDHDSLWAILFDPIKNKKENIIRLEEVFQSDKHNKFFMNVLLYGMDDPKNWDKWVNTFVY